MERITVVKHWYLTAANLNHMRWLGVAIAAGGLAGIVIALDLPAWAHLGFWGWLATLVGLIMFWGGTYEAIVEKKDSWGDGLALWAVGLAVVFGVPLLLVVVL